MGTRTRLGLILAMALVAQSTYAQTKEAGLSSPSVTSHEVGVATLQPSAQDILKTLDSMELALVQSVFALNVTAMTVATKQDTSPEVLDVAGGRVSRNAKSVDQMSAFNTSYLAVSSPSGGRNVSVLERKASKTKVKKLHRIAVSYHSSVRGGDNRICPLSSGVAPLHS